MPNIQPLAMASITDPELRDLITRCEKLGVPDAVFPRILAHVPSYAKALLRALLMSHTEGNVDHRLKEIIRVRLAGIAGDSYFGTLRSKQAKASGLTEERIAAATKFNEGPYTPAEKLAIQFAVQMYLDADQNDAAFYARFKEHYSEAQIMELGAFIAFHYGMQVFMRTVDARPGVSA
ncbi:MAG: carboxymuconolactone decarboxylase family protein [Betaproteobacteria bacterium]|nr:carboxymuconolactone decarboxylase family protein [Betaproteobacteria bacterium]